MFAQRGSTDPRCRRQTYVQARICRSLASKLALQSCGRSKVVNLCLLEGDRQIRVVNVKSMQKARICRSLASELALQSCGRSEGIDRSALQAPDLRASQDLSILGEQMNVCERPGSVDTCTCVRCKCPWRASYLTYGQDLSTPALACGAGVPGEQFATQAKVTYALP
jgi:hypothetical protein